MKTKPKCSLLATKVGWRVKDATGRMLTITEIDDCGYRWCDRMGKNRYLQKFTCAGDPLLNAARNEYAVKVFPPVGESRRGKFVDSRFAGDAPVELQSAQRQRSAGRQMTAPTTRDVAGSAASPCWADHKVACWFSCGAASACAAHLVLASARVGRSSPATCWPAIGGRMTLRDQVTIHDGKIVRNGLYAGSRDSGLWSNGFEACNDIWHEALERSCMDMSLCRRCGKPVICLPDGLSNICDPCSEMENA
jgi:hypothetical protein